MGEIGRIVVRWLAVLAPCLVCLGAAWIEPGPSQAQDHTGDHAARSSQPSDRNWHAFWRHHLGEWTGRWTRYTPSGDVKETFASSRLFSAEPSGTEIVQVNTYRYADGRTIQKQWSYNIFDHSLNNGFAHPASASMRGLALNNGAAAWLVPHLQRDQFAPFELFLKQGDVRHSVGIVYNKSGQLLRTASIRERRGPDSNSPWTNTLAQMEPWSPNGSWTGTGQRIHADLSLVPLQQTDWQWTTTSQSMHFFPDRIILRCPEQLVAGQPFSIAVVWQVSDDALQTITADYDSTARLVAVTHQSLKQRPEASASITSRTIKPEISD